MQGRKLRQGRRGADVAFGRGSCLQVRGLPFKGIGGTRRGLADVLGMVDGIISADGLWLPVWTGVGLLCGTYSVCSEIGGVMVNRSELQV